MTSTVGAEGKIIQHNNEEDMYNPTSHSHKKPLFQKATTVVVNVPSLVTVRTLS